MPRGKNNKITCIKSSNLQQSNSTQMAELNVLKSHITEIAQELNNIHSALMITLLGLPHWVKLVLVHDGSPIYKLIVQYAEPKILASMQLGIDYIENVFVPGLINKYPNFDAQTILHRWRTQLSWENIHRLDFIENLINKNNSIKSAAGLLNTYIKTAIMAAFNSEYDHYLVPILISTELVTFLIKNFVVDPLLFKCLPYSIFGLKIPYEILEIEHTHKYSSEAVTDKIILLNKKTDHLKRIQKIHNFVMRIGIAAYLTWFTLDFISAANDNEANKMFNGVTLHKILNPTTVTLAISSSTYLIKDIYRTYKSYNLQKTLQKALTQLINTTSSIKYLQDICPWELYANETSSHSFFAFNLPKNFNKKINPAYIVEMLKYYLIKEGVEIWKYGKYSLNLKADIVNEFINNSSRHKKFSWFLHTLNVSNFSKDSLKTEAIESRFENGLQRLILMQQNQINLFDQYQKLFNTMNVIVSFRRIFDDNDLPNFEIYANLSLYSDQEIDIFKSTIQPLYPKAQFSLKESSLFITGYEIADKNELNRVLNLQAAKNLGSYLQKFFSILPDSNSTLIELLPLSNRAKKRTNIDAATQPLVAKTNTQQRLIIVWNETCQYDSNDNHCQIVPIHKPGFVGCFFARYTAEIPSDYGNFNDRYRDIVMKGTMGGKKKQGISDVVHSLYIKNPSGKWFFPLFKAKGLGSHIGDGRVYGEVEAKVTVDGKERVLVNFNTFISHTH